MANFHPILAGVPATLYVTAAILHLLASVKFRELRSAVLALTAMVWIVVPLTFLSGYLDADSASRSVKVPEELIMSHEAWGRVVLIANFALLPLYVIAERARYNQRLFRKAFDLLLAGLVLVSLYTSFLGGELVFTHGAGVAFPRSQSQTEF